MTIDEIRELLKSGDVAGAEAAAKAALENDPDNVRLLIVFGTCRQLQGDEEAFLGTYELVRTALAEKKVELDATAAEEWKRFEALHERIAQPELLRIGNPPRTVNLMEWVVIAVLVASTCVLVFVLFQEGIQKAYYSLKGDVTELERTNTKKSFRTLYGGAEYQSTIEEDNIQRMGEP